MNVRKAVRSVAPEFAIRMARRALGRPASPLPQPEQPPPPWEYLPLGWRTQDARIAGWNVPSIADAQRTKWASFVASIEGTGPLGVSHEAPAGSGREDTWAHNLIMSYAYVVTLAARHKDRLSMLDWGGGSGHYQPLTKAILPDLQLEYFCQDVPMLCDVGRSLVTDGIFFGDPDACFDRTYDFVHAGSSLWCVEDWKGSVARLASVAEDYLYVTRMLFVRDEESFVVVQRPASYGYQTEYQLWVLNEREFVAHVETLGMTLVREFVFGKGPHLAGAPEQGSFKGFLFRRHAPLSG